MKRTSSDMVLLIESYKNRDCSQLEFCKQNNISKAVLGYWLNKLSKKQQRVKETKDFKPLKIAIPHKKYIELKTPSGIEIRIPL